MDVRNVQPNLAYGNMMGMDPTTGASNRLQGVKNLARGIIQSPGNPKHEAPQLMMFILTVGGSVGLCGDVRADNFAFPRTQRRTMTSSATSR